MTFKREFGGRPIALTVASDKYFGFRVVTEGDEIRISRFSSVDGKPVDRMSPVLLTRAQAKALGEALLASDELFD